MGQLDKWVGQKVRLLETIQARVMVGRELARSAPDMVGRRTELRVALHAGELFSVISHYRGRLDLLYQPVKMPEKVILHVPLHVLELL